MNRLLKEEISEIIRLEMKDPRLGFVTVTDAEVTADLRHAKIYVSILASAEEQKVSLAVLKNSQRFVRQEFAKRSTMKVLPEIEFCFDESVERGARMSAILGEIKHDDHSESS